MQNINGHRLTRSLRIAFFVVSIFVIVIVPVRGEIDPQYKERLPGLTANFLTTGFNEEDIQRLFSDERVELYPQILERSAKGLPYFSPSSAVINYDLCHYV